MHIYAHIPQRIMCPRVIYRAAALVYLAVTFPRCFSRFGRRGSLFLPFILFLEGRTRFSSFDGNPVVSDQRQLGTYPLLSALVCSSPWMPSLLPRFQMSFPSHILTPVRHSTRYRLPHRRSFRDADVDIYHFCQTGRYKRSELESANLVLLGIQNS